MATVLKYLDISLAHIKYSDYLLLRERPCCLTVLPHDHGWWVSVPGDDDYIQLEMIEMGFSPSFIRLMELAASLECIWVLFDIDGNSVDSLETHMWDFLPQGTRLFFGARS